jgi:hypothetical protein
MLTNTPKHIGTQNTLTQTHMQRPQRQINTHKHKITLNAHAHKRTYLQAHRHTHTDTRTHVSTQTHKNTDSHSHTHTHARTPNSHAPAQAFAEANAHSLRPHRMDVHAGRRVCVCVRRRVRVRPCRRERRAHENGARGRHVAAGAVDARCLLDDPRAPRPPRGLLQPRLEWCERCCGARGRPVHSAYSGVQCSGRTGGLGADHSQPRTERTQNARTHAQPGSESGSARGGSQRAPA